MLGGRAGVRLTIRKHYFFSPATTERLQGPLAGSRAWDALRSGDDEPDFALPAATEDWHRICAQPSLVSRGARIASLAREVGASAIVSYGVGTACVEYHAQAADPGLSFHLSDFGAETVARLRAVFPGAASVEVIDLLQDELPQPAAALVVLHRLDTEFTNEELRTIFKRVRRAGDAHVLVAPTGFLTLRELLAELWRRLAALVRRRPATNVGQVRTRAVYESFWRDQYRVRAEGPLADGHYILLEAL